MRGAKTVPGVELNLSLGDDVSTKVVVRVERSWCVSIFIQLRSHRLGAFHCRMAPELQHYNIPLREIRLEHDAA